MNLGGTPTAILRMYDRFGTLALQNLAASVTRLLACATALFFGCSVLGFGIASLCGDIASNLFLLVASCLRLRAEGVARIWSANARGHIQRNRSLVQFALSSHLNSTVRVSRELDVMVVAAFSSASAAGVYKAGHKFASFLSVLTDPFYQVLYPELNRIIVAGDLSAFRRTMRFGAVAAGLSAAGALLIGLLVAKPMIAHLLNVQFTDAFGVFAICGIGWVLWGFSTPLTPALLAMGKAPTALAVHAAAAATYLPLLIWLASIVGAIGAATAFVAFNTIWAALMLLVLQAEFSLWSKSRQEASVQLSSATAAAQPGSRGNPLGDSS
ncbi:MAG TPA: hypothetical protein VFQ61_21595 [Polyangiaceae bacterium]|nr:hypothetical protein [Polyangiaceae bacterium]